MGRYAEGTTVTEARSKEEIERTIRRYGGASPNLFSEDELEPQQLGAGFRLSGRTIRIALPVKVEREALPTWENAVSARYRKNRDRARLSRERQRIWRVILLIIKTQCELIEDGTLSVDDAFTAWLLLPSGRTVGEWLHAQIVGGESVPLLLAAREERNG